MTIFILAKTENIATLMKRALTVILNLYLNLMYECVDRLIRPQISPNFNVRILSILFLHFVSYKKVKNMGISRS